MNENLAVKKIFAPIVKWMIYRGITYPIANQILKEVYAEAGLASVEEGKKPNASAISLMTGLHRKDLKNLFEKGDIKFENKLKSSLKTQIFSIWLSSDFATDEDGEPIAIPQNGENSFETLADKVSKDVAPGSILKDALNKGYINQLDNNYVALEMDALIDSNDTEEQLYFFSTNLSDHASAAVSNLMNDQSKFLERAVFFDGLTKTDIETIKKYLENEAKTLIYRANKRSRQTESDQQNEPKNHRFKFGLYYFDEKL